MGVPSPQPWGAHKGCPYENINRVRSDMGRLDGKVVLISGGDRGPSKHA